MLAQALYNNNGLAVPRFLFRSSRYVSLSIQAKLVYALLLESLQYCHRRNWFDENGDIYVLLPQEAIGQSLGLGKNAVYRAFDNLKKYGLIEIVQQGLCLPNRIYVHEPVLNPEEMDTDACQDLLLG